MATDNSIEYPDALVLPQERIVRFILKPKNINTDGSLKEGFVKLRNEEPGVSCVRYDFLGGKEATKANGKAFAELFNKPKNGKPIPPQRLQKLHGWGQCTAQDIIALDPEVIELIVDNPEERPYHVCICFRVDGEIVKGEVKNAYILDLFQKIEDTFEYVFFEETEV